MIFISKREREAIRARVQAMPAPILSLYTRTFPEQQNRLATTVKRTLQLLEGVPPKLAAQVIAFAERDRPLGRSLALFAGPQLFETVPFGMDLPFVDPTTGMAEARWGTPYLAPLDLALDQHERFGILFVDGWRARVFEVFLGGIDAVLERTREDSPQSHDQLEQSKQVHPAYTPSRGGAALDNAEEHTEEWRDRFYRRLVPELEQQIAERAIGALILMGPNADVEALRGMLPPGARERVAEVLPSLANPEASPSEVLERVAPTVRRIDAARDSHVLERVDEDGVHGMAETIRTLQAGQLAVIAIPWHLEEAAYVNRTTGYVALEESVARGHSDALATTERVSLWDILPGLASQFGTETVFLTGDERGRLVDQYGGLAGIKRW